jgi:hypothetical protein
MIRKSFFLILVFALLSVPVFLMAHAFTHFAQVDALDITEAENDDDADRDEICLDCLAFTALSIILIVSGAVSESFSATSALVFIGEWTSLRQRFLSILFPRTPLSISNHLSF